MSNTQLAPGKVKSICGAVNLLAAIFSEDSNELKLRYGLPLGKRKPLCLNCRNPRPLHHKKFCSVRCEKEYSHIPVTCEGCGKQFKRQASQIVYHMGKRGQKHIFCGRRCFSRFAGRTYGFGAHPENVPARKWDWNRVYEARNRTGWGSLRLSKLLGIPKTTISKILAKSG